VRIIFVMIGVGVVVDSFTISKHNSTPPRPCRIAAHHTSQPAAEATHMRRRGPVPYRVGSTSVREHFSIDRSIDRLID
jgi:hypothetical protein